MRKINDPDALSNLMNAHQLSGLFDEKTVAAMELFAFDKGEIVCTVDDRLDHLFMLVKGKIKIYRVLPNGKSILIRFYNPLSTIGDLEMLTDLTVRNTVESVNDTLFIGIHQQALADTAHQDPGFLRFIIKHLSHKLHTFLTASSLNLLYPVETRFASYLVSITVDENDQAQIEEIKAAKLTEIAELLGTSYRHLNRVISQFASAGLVERSRGSLYVKDINQLKKLANGNLYS
ncbi:cyclic nucleotide-binding domain-containing protein [Cohnella luojiensis]|uniref:Cyclic nucleotide-binding domain-containing protein n=1 Tax=Cohnella luojiensis TaxID=652876 RepID=A0A4Y8LN73_9BACL|nr:cyclic nucleotide-binding domain-containing protein [Cohnella luojiensis]TFE19702.1 cyclic nucleotide-binding domain-containing protein [Cohnella luojiensis]